MADKGAIAKLPAVFPLKLSDWVCRWPLYAPINYKTFRPTNGTIGGVVSEAGIPIENVKVFLHWRKSMACIAIAYTNSSGAYSFTGLDPTAQNDYVVVIQDRDGGTVYNDAIFALVAPTT